MKNKYLFLYLKTGGGHLAPAKSVSSFILKNFPESVEPILIDGFAETPSYIRRTVEDGYRRLQSRAQWIYEGIYLLNKIPAIAKLNTLIVSHFVKPFLEKTILNERPEKIVIFHFLLIKPVYELLRKHRLEIPVVTVVTDPYTAHPIWFQEEKQHYVVFSNELKERCLQKNIPGERISVFPFVLEEKYSTPLPDAEIKSLKRHFGFAAGKKIILIMGGGDGIPKGTSILKHIVRSNTNAEIVIVCGNNKRLFERALAWVERNGFSHIRVLGYVEYVYELLNIADIVITKCGASMFMQTLMSKKIAIVNNYLWEQEKGNVDYLRDNNLGIYEKRVSKLPASINRLLGDASLSSMFLRNIENASLQNGTDQVSRFIVNFQGI